ncbi:MAG TPA: hypothetical protein P5572_07105 [Phycisphaerae bacterium]|nr:hypothetical protein [Phycisphaerales bacterium]HRX84769.1 hypothetical protein [Phycisphaerae bacterium]
MNRLRLRRLASGAVAAALLLMTTGCTFDTSTITFLDVVNTVLLAITAAGGIVLIKNV